MRTSRTIIRTLRKRPFGMLLIAGLVALAFVTSRSSAGPPSRGSSGRTAPNQPQAVRNADVFVEHPDDETEPSRIDLDRDLAIKNVPPSNEGALLELFHPDQLVSREGLGSTLRMTMLLTVLSLVPSILVMTTCFVRFAIVLSLLRQALGTPQLPPNQVLMALCLFLTFLLMKPVWQQSYDAGIRPYTHPAPDDPPLSLAEVFDRSARPIRSFMSTQIEQAGNGDAVWMLLDYEQAAQGAAGVSPDDAPGTYDEVSLPILTSAYLLSELKVGFLIGFKIFLPFLVLDLVVATVLTSLGMMMLPPTLVSFPFKLLLFVLIDGWALTVGTMLASVRPLY